MSGVVVIDANLMILLVVGSASPDYIVKHKRLQDYTIDHFEILGLLISEFSEIVLLPHVLAEVSNLSRQIGRPARARVQYVLKTLIETATELPIPSVLGAKRNEFDELGLTDAILLHICSMQINGLNPTLLTADTDLADSASSLGYSLIDFRREYQTE